MKNFFFNNRWEIQIFGVINYAIFGSISWAWMIFNQRFLNEFWKLKYRFCDTLAPETLYLPICKFFFEKTEHFRSFFWKKRLNWRKNRFVFGKMSRLLKKRLNFEKPSNKCNCFSRILVWINEIINEKTTHTFVFWKNE